MSLLDDVSLMITPNGIAEDVLFGALPQPTEGTENIDLTTGSVAAGEWGTATTSGIAKTSGATTTSLYNTGFTVTTGKTYKVSFTISSYSGSNVIGFAAQGGVGSDIRLSGNGSITGYFTATSNSVLQLFGKDTNTGVFSNVSVKEYISADMAFTRATTATRVDSSGILVSVATGVPRLDYTGASCPHILAEPGRTNLVVNSITGRYGNAPGSSTQVTAPDNTNTAVKPVPNNVDDRYEEIIAGGTYATNTKLTYSWYRKRISTPVDTSFVGDLDVKNIVNGSISSVATQIESDVNGFDRFSVTFNITDGSLESKFRLYFGNVIGVGNSSVAYWGHQLEEGIYNTSLIPTSGSTVTRNEELFTRTGISSLINSAEGVLFAEIEALADDGTNRQISLSDGTADNRVTVGFSSSTDFLLGQIKTKVTGSSVFSMNKTPSITQINNNKIALKWKVDDMAIWLNGSEVATDNSGAAPINLDRLTFDKGDGANDFFGKIKQLQVYKTALTDDQLAALTT